jgi:hypothetical protein
MENKTSKYFKYAIGEIVLVVIGILIALQINNWNENRKQHITELAFAKNLVKDLNEDTRALEITIEFNNLKLAKLDSLLKYAGTDINAIENQNQLYQLVRSSISQVAIFQNQNRTLLKLSTLNSETIRNSVADSIALFQQDILEIEKMGETYMTLILDANTLSHKLFKMYHFRDENYFVNDKFTGELFPPICEDLALQDEFFNTISMVYGATKNYTKNYLVDQLQQTKDLKIFLKTEYNL